MERCFISLKLLLLGLLQSFWYFLFSGSMTHDEEEVSVAPIRGMVTGYVQPTGFRMLGKFLSSRIISGEVIRTTFKVAWKMDKGFVVETFGKNIFLFTFDREGDQNCIMQQITEICTQCGIIDHNVKACGKFFEIKNSNEQSHHYGDWIRYDSKLNQVSHSPIKESFLSNKNNNSVSPQVDGVVAMSLAGSLMAITYSLDEMATSVDGQKINP